VTKRKASIVFAPAQVSLQTGAGPSNYFGTGATTATDVGAAWDARVLFGAHSIIAIEAGYVGSSNTIDSPLGNRGHISSNGFDGDFRLQLPWRLQPYIFSGVGYNHMSTTTGNNPTLVLLQTEDNQVVIPAGGGVSVYFLRHATLDIRGTYRFIPDNEVSAMPNHSLNQWLAQARVGYTF
jgi:hypothetical protein